MIASVRFAVVVSALCLAPLSLVRAGEIQVLPDDSSWGVYVNEGSPATAAITAAKPRAGLGSLEFNTPPAVDSAAFLTGFEAPGPGTFADLQSVDLDWLTDPLSSHPEALSVAVAFYFDGDSRSFWLVSHGCTSDCDTLPTGLWHRTSTTRNDLEVVPGGPDAPTTLEEIASGAPVSGIHLWPPWANQEGWHGFIDEVTLTFTGQQPTIWNFEVASPPPGPPEPLFANGFESGTLCAWGGAQGAPPASGCDLGSVLAGLGGATTPTQNAQALALALETALASPPPEFSAVIPAAGEVAAARPDAKTNTISLGELHALLIGDLTAPTVGDAIAQLQPLVAAAYANPAAPSSAEFILMFSGSSGPLTSPLPLTASTPLTLMGVLLYPQWLASTTVGSSLRAASPGDCQSEVTYNALASFAKASTSLVANAGIKLLNGVTSVEKALPACAAPGIGSLVSAATSCFQSQVLSHFKSVPPESCAANIPLALDSTAGCVAGALTWADTCLNALRGIYGSVTGLAQEITNLANATCTIYQNHEPSYGECENLAPKCDACGPSGVDLVVDRTCKLELGGCPRGAEYQAPTVRCDYQTPAECVVHTDITPPSTQVAIGQSVNLTAKALDNAGNWVSEIDPATGFQWSSDPTGIVSLDQGTGSFVGTATGLQDGQTAVNVEVKGAAPGTGGTAQVCAGSGACDMVFVPAGSFTMGSNSGNSDEQPVHTVYLDAYWIDRTEVTVDAYAACVAAGGCTAPNGNYGSATYCNYGAPGRGNHPINCVDWYKSQAYCTWAGKRLPTEAEWEKAARDSDARTYPWGEATATCAYAVMNDASAGGNGCGLNHTAPVGSKPAGASPYGALDMAGNVWEWVNDWYSSTYYWVSPSANPPGPAGGNSRVLRGGSWDDNSGFGYLRASNRTYDTPAFWSDFVGGFRCSRDGG